jgi:hypothetical protein
VLQVAEGATQEEGNKEEATWASGCQASQELGGEQAVQPGQGLIGDPRQHGVLCHARCFDTASFSVLCWQSGCMTGLMVGNMSAMPRHRSLARWTDPL